METMIMNETFHLEIGENLHVINIVKYSQIDRFAFYVYMEWTKLT